MYKRYYDSYRPNRLPCSNNGEIITPRCTEDTYCQEEKEKTKCEEKKALAECCDSKPATSKSLFSLPLEADDIILGIILILLLADSDSVDPIMLVIIGLVLFSDSF